MLNHIDFIGHHSHIFTYLAESPLDHREEEARVWALELHSSFCYSLLLCKPFIWLRLRASLALCQFWLLPVFSSWLCQFGCSRKVVNCQIGCLELYSAQTSIDCRLMYTLQNSYIPIPCNERYCVPQVSIRIGSTLFYAS